MVLVAGIASSTASHSANSAELVSRALQAIPDIAFDRDVMLIGEAHGRALSYRLVDGVIGQALDRGYCPILALEVRHDQTRAWRGGDPLKLSTVHDSPAYRDALSQWAERYRSNCVRLAMIDATPDERRDPDFAGRDQNMARRLAKLVGRQGPVIALLGNNHIDRRVDWAHEGLAQSVGYELDAAGYELTVIGQAFRSIDDPRLIIADDRASSVAAFNRFQWHRNVRPAERLTDHIDILINWSADTHS